ncbi:hypothetical protein [Candidatus Palauibacter irciniicola]|uniref:hypothetical protein n=1 Tax=Candidatus Palauibacter irciniicola TaxID=3056733 RepID=UPI003B02AA4F
MPRVNDRRGTTGTEREPMEELHFKGVMCGACGLMFPKGQLDADDWCEACGPRMQRRMRIWRHVVAAGITLPFGVWVVVWLRASPELGFLPAYAWGLPLVAAYYLGFRIGREVVKGYTRWRLAR